SASGPPAAVASALPCAAAATAAFAGTRFPTSLRVGAVTSARTPARCFYQTAATRFLFGWSKKAPLPPFDLRGCTREELLAVTDVTLLREMLRTLPLFRHTAGAGPIPPTRGNSSQPCAGVLAN